MAVVVIFGLIVATFLTLVVVPTLFYLQKRFIEHTKRFWDWLYNKYWGVYDKLVDEPIE